MQNFKTKFYPQFLTSGVGSIPYNEIPQALSLIWNNVPEAPHWPQLPKLGSESSFVGQYLRALVDTGVIGDYEQPRFQVEASDWMERLTSFYDLYLRASEDDEQALESFSFDQEGGAGFEAFCKDLDQFGTRGAVLLKGQISGPLTVGLQITDKNRRSSYYDEQLRDVLVKGLALHAEWQTKRLRSYGLPVLIMIDDPALYAYGASTHVTLERASIINDLNSIASKITGQGGICGVHVCAGMDWTLLFDSDIQVINFDAYEYMTSMIVLAKELNRFLERGGVLSWGIVPTNEKAWEETSESLQARLESNISELVKRGVNEELLRRQSMLTPSCGTGTLEESLAAKIYELLGKIGSAQRKNLPVFPE